MLVKFILWGFLLYLSHCENGNEKHRCDVGIGIESGEIPDDNISDDLEGTFPAKARLNKDSSWCFDAFDVKKTEVHLTIDLGRLALVSGAKSQGPPTSIKPVTYKLQIGFYILLSTASEGNDDWKLFPENLDWFKAVDYDNETGVVSIHPLNKLVPARRVRFKFRTGVMWDSDAEMCFRIEILGCPKDVVPKTNLRVEAYPSGWLEAKWDEPRVVIPTHNSSLFMEMIVRNFVVNITKNDVNLVPEATEVRKYVLKNPVWGGTYIIYVICPYLNFNLTCGSVTKKALLESCSANDEKCNLQNTALFQSPCCLQAVTDSESSDKIKLSWDTESSGWVTSKMDLAVFQIERTQIFQTEIDYSVRNITLKGLAIDQSYKISFIPKPESLKTVPTFDFLLHLISWKALDNSSTLSGHGIFIADVSLEASVVWNGTLKVTWQKAMVIDAASANTVINVSATSYTVTLSNGNKGNVNSVETSALFLTFQDLSLESQYTVNIMCNFASKNLSCGLATVYTAKSFYWWENNEDLHVYTTIEPGTNWLEQENWCQKGEGHLVSFGSKQEDLQLTPILKHREALTSFWIGFNMCLDSPFARNIWTDGSKREYDQLGPVSSTECCLKALLDDDSEKFKWFGEMCQTPLPGLCEYHPEGLVGQITSLQRGNRTTTSAKISWDYQQKYWQPSNIFAEICSYRDLASFQPIPQSTEVCQNTTLSKTSDKTEFKNLKEFTEYSVRLAGELRPMQYIGPSADIFVRTYSSTPLAFHINASGHSRFMWAEKIAEFDDEAVIAMTFDDLDQSKTISKEYITPKGKTLMGIRLGGHYRIQLEETTGERKEQIEFYAYPTCLKGVPYMQWCFLVTPSLKTFKEARDECIKLEAVLLTSSTSKQLKLLLNLATSTGRDLWVSPDSVLGKGIPPANSSVPNLSALVVEHETDIIDPFLYEHEERGTKPTSTTAAPISKCLMVSRAYEKIVESGCEQLQFAACSQKVPVVAFPDPTAMEITKGENFIKLNWPNNITAWEATYTVYYQRSRERRYKRQLNSLSFLGPPVSINNLESGTSYLMELEAKLGMDVSSFSKQFEVETLNTGGFAQYAAGFSVGWAATADYRLAHIICGSLLIVACITTMLLFLATGMFYQDCMAHLGFLSSIIGGYFFLLLGHPDFVSSENMIECIVVASFLHYFFLCSFVFIGLESLTIAHLLLRQVKSPFEKNSVIMMITGTVAPALYVLISSGIIQYGYINVISHNCWLNYDGAAAFTEVIANLIVFVASIVLLGWAASVSQNLPEMSHLNLRVRQRDVLTLRWVILAIVIELGALWLSGTSAYHTRNDTAHAIFAIFTLILAITIIACRTYFDETFRSKFHRLCCSSELTYKRNEILGLSARSKVSPSGGVTIIAPPPSVTQPPVKPTGRRSFSADEARHSLTSILPEYNLPNTPPQEGAKNVVLIRRSYNFANDS